MLMFVAKDKFSHTDDKSIIIGPAKKGKSSEDLLFSSIISLEFKANLKLHPRSKHIFHWILEYIFNVSNKTGMDVCIF